MSSEIPRTASVPGAPTELFTQERTSLWSAITGLVDRTFRSQPHPPQGYTQQGHWRAVENMSVYATVASVFAPEEPLVLTREEILRDHLSFEQFQRLPIAARDDEAIAHAAILHDPRNFQYISYLRRQEPNLAALSLETVRTINWNRHQKEEISSSLFRHMSVAVKENIPVLVAALHVAPINVLLRDDIAPEAVYALFCCEYTQMHRIFFPEQQVLLENVTTILSHGIFATLNMRLHLYQETKNLSVLHPAISMCRGSVNEVRTAWDLFASRARPELQNRTLFQFWSCIAIDARAPREMGELFCDLVRRTDGADIWNLLKGALKMQEWMLQPADWDLLFQRLATSAKFKQSLEKYGNLKMWRDYLPLLNAEQHRSVCASLLRCFGSSVIRFIPKDLKKSPEFMLEVLSFTPEWFERDLGIFSASGIEVRSSERIYGRMMAVQGLASEQYVRVMSCVPHTPSFHTVAEVRGAWERICRSGKERAHFLIRLLGAESIDNDVYAEPAMATLFCEMIECAPELDVGSLFREINDRNWQLPLHLSGEQWVMLWGRLAKSKTFQQDRHSLLYVPSNLRDPDAWQEYVQLFNADAMNHVPECFKNDLQWVRRVLRFQSAQITRDARILFLAGILPRTDRVLIQDLLACAQSESDRNRILRCLPIMPPPQFFQLSKRSYDPFHPIQWDLQPEFTPDDMPWARESVQKCIDLAHLDADDWKTSELQAFMNGLVTCTAINDRNMRAVETNTQQLLSKMMRFILCHAGNDDAKLAHIGAVLKGAIEYCNTHRNSAVEQLAAFLMRPQGGELLICVERTLAKLRHCILQEVIQGLVPSTKRGLEVEFMAYFTARLGPSLGVAAGVATHDDNGYLQLVPQAISKREELVESWDDCIQEQFRRIYHERLAPHLRDWLNSVEALAEGVPAKFGAWLASQYFFDDEESAMLDDEHRFTLESAQRFLYVYGFTEINTIQRKLYREMMRSADPYAAFKHQIAHEPQLREHAPLILLLAQATRNPRFIDEASFRVQSKLSFQAEIGVLTEAGILPGSLRLE